MAPQIKPLEIFMLYFNACKSGDSQTIGQSAKFATVALVAAS